MEFGILKDRVRPPLLAEGWISRPRLLTALDARAREFAVVAIIAGPGYGKTSIAAEWVSWQRPPWAWLTLAPGEDDPHSLLLYLRASLVEAGLQLDLERVDALVRQGFAAGRWKAAVDALLSLPIWSEQNVWLVLDDLHHVEGEAAALVDYLLRFRPTGLRLLLTSRRTPGSSGGFPSWSRLMAQGQVGLLGAAELAFTPDDWPAAECIAATAGWPLAIDLARRGLPALSSESEELLQREFWESLDQSEQELLERCAALDFLAQEACEQLCPDLPVAAVLERLRRHGALVQPWSHDHLRLHPLFLDFLRRRLKADQRKWAQIYQRSAALLLSQGQLPSSLSLLQQAPGQRSLEQVAQELLAQGAYERLSRWVESLGPEHLGLELRSAYAQALGSSYRFEHALAQYAQLSQELEGADRGRSLLAAGRLLVTTLQPQRARHWLTRAYRLLPQEERLPVLELLAENSLNQGQSRHAQRFRQLATRHGPGRDEDMFRLRLLLRTGQIAEARALAEGAGPTDGGQEGHRDRELVLAYLLALEGSPQPAESLCRRALRNARDKGSVFSEAVALMRLGHALQLQAEVEPAAVFSCYEEALSLAGSTGATRLKAEAHMGRALFHASRGEVAESYQDALDGLDLTRQAGDAWLSAWMRLCVAISARQGEHPDAMTQFDLAEEELQKVRDRFGLCLVALWRSLDDPEQLPAAAARAQAGGYRFLLQRITFFGPRILPAHWSEPASPGRPQGTLALPEPEVPPLRICLLGPLRIFRAGQELPPQAFKRRKARELLGLLLAQRGQPLSKERLWDLLFPDSDADKAARDLRVSFHALFDVLDPDRPHNHPARWVTRRDDLYAIPWVPELSLDWRDYEKQLELAEGGDQARNWERALQLVQGELLLDFAGCDWALSLREGWRTSYLVTATRLANHYLEQDRNDQCLALAHTILEQERCWEAGYRLLMQAHLRAGRAAQATRVYDLCLEVLQQELGVEPSEETEKLYSQALGGS